MLTVKWPSNQVKHCEAWWNISYTLLKVLGNCDVSFYPKQDTLSDLKGRCEAAELELKNSDRQINGVLCEIEQTKRHNSSLESRLHEINSENMKLQLQIQEQEERQQTTLSVYNNYRAKMEDHRMAVAEAESQTPIYKELMEARERVKQLTEKRDALMIDLQNPEGQAARQAQVGVMMICPQLIFHTWFSWFV